MHQQNGSSLIFQLTAAACLVNGVITGIFFLLYIKARMADQSTEPGRDEARYQSIHFITLFLFVLFGVLVLIQLSNRYNYVPPGGRYSTAPAQENKLFYPPAGSAIQKNRS
jgi:cytochrome bd-type quinol oxidase subunit 2